MSLTKIIAFFLGICLWLSDEGKTEQNELYAVCEFMRQLQHRPGIQHQVSHFWLSSAQ